MLIRLPFLLRDGEPTAGTPPDLAAEIEAQKKGEGPLSVSERIELNELKIVKADRGKLGALNAARLEHLLSREAIQPPAPAPPPAASAALAGQRTERELALEAERDAARQQAEAESAARRAAETKAAEVEDSFHRYKKAVEEPKPKKKSGWAPVIDLE